MSTAMLLPLLALCPQTPAPAAPTQGWTQAELERVALEIQGDIEKLRGEAFKAPVKVKLASKADLRAYVEERLRKTETPEKLAADALVGKLLGVIPPELDVMAETLRLLDSQVVGFYDPDSDSFSLMDGCPLGLARMTMAHELGHALDDQLYGIDAQLAKLGKDTDAQLAYWCVVEGSATLVGNRWQMANARSLDAASMAAAGEMMKGTFDQSPQWLWKPLIGSYLVGSGFLARSEKWLSAQMASVPSADVARAFQAPPVSTEVALHPAKYWDESKLDLPQRLELVAASVPNGWSVLREDTLGEFSCAIVSLAPAKRGGVDLSNPMAMMGLTFTSKAASGWDGDRLALLAKGEARALRWRSVWDSPEDAAEFRAALAEQLAHQRACVEKLGANGLHGVELAEGLAPTEVELLVWTAVAAEAELAELRAGVQLQVVQ
ncbi:MAG: hypothetical protein FJ294_10210 [Planctomycetes bacterium]|nr:hypothetical protein [Planctomycetota bacterium]